MTRRPLAPRQPLPPASAEDQRTYRKWMRILAVTYCSLFLFAIGTASLRLHQNSVASTAPQTLSVAHLD